jgi:hypothetical protein
VEIVHYQASTGARCANPSWDAARRRATVDEDKRKVDPDQPRIAQDGYVIGARLPRSPSLAAAIDKQLAEGFRQHALKQAFKDSSDEELIDEMRRRGYALRKIR